MPGPNLLNRARYALAASCSFYLFDSEWCFLPWTNVLGSVRVRTGSVTFEGPFCIELRPARRVPFADTGGLGNAIQDALRFEPGPPMSFERYEATLREGLPVLREFGLAKWAEVGKRAYYFRVYDYGSWLELIRLPWKHGQFWPWADWTKVLRATPSRDRAFERAALTLQKEFPPSGFEFKPGRGLVKENLQRMTSHRHLSPTRLRWPTGSSL